MAANLLTTISIMLFEGGALIDALSAGTQSQALANKIEQADRNAMEAGKTEFDLELDPIEIGMAIDALTKGSSPLSQSLGQKLTQALSSKLQELGVNYGNQSGGLDQQPQPQQGLGDESSPEQPAEQSPSSDTASEDADAEQDSDL